MMRLSSLALVLSSAVVTTGLTPQRAPAVRPQSSEVKQQQRTRVDDLVRLARSAPPEIGADGLIRLAESDLVTGKARKRELLEEAFRLAAGAGQPFKRLYVGGEVDTRAGYLGHAFSLQLDALTLQCRAVRAMLAVDKQKAREIFATIPPRLKLPPLGCEDALVYDVGIFYDTLRMVAAETFSAEEKGQDLHVQFVNSYVDAMASPSQVGPVSIAITSLNPTAPQLSLLVGTFGRALKQIAGDDRSFTYSMTRDASVFNAVKELAVASERKNVPPRELLEEFRSYLVRHLSGKRCADNLSGPSPEEPRYVEAANNILRLDTPISPDETKPAEIGGRVNTYAYWKSQDARRLSAKIRKLRFGRGARPLTDAEKDNPEWRTELADFLTDLANWNGRGEKAEADFFHQKSVLYVASLKLLPPGQQQEVVLQSYLAFATNSTMQKESPVEWLMQVRPLIEQARSLAGNDRARFMEGLNRSNNAPLLLYVGLAELTSKPRL